MICNDKRLNEGSPISIKVLEEQKMPSKNLIIFLGFLRYFSFIFRSTSNTLKFFCVTREYLKLFLSLWCANQMKHLNYFKTISFWFFEMKWLTIKCKILGCFWSSAAPLFVLTCAVGWSLMQDLILLPAPQYTVSLPMKTLWSCLCMTISDHLC